MKKLCALFLLLCFTFLLTACVSTPEPGTEPPAIPTQVPTAPPTESPTTVPTEPEPTQTPPTTSVIYDLPMISVVCAPIQEVTNGASGSPIFQYTYQDIQLTLPDTAISAAIDSDITQRINSTQSDAADLKDASIAAEPKYPYSLSVIYEPQRIDGTVLSFFGTHTLYNGGSVLHSGRGLTYDLTTGSVLTLDDILTDSVTADTLCALVTAALSELPEETYLFGDYAGTVETRFSENFLSDESWHLSKAGLCFTFAPYEVAPNSSGFVHALIPYEQLTGVLADAWFPPEEITPAGALHISSFTQEIADPFDMFTEVVLDKENALYLIHTDGILYDLVIEYGVRTGDRFTPEYTVFRADSLVSANAVTLQANGDTLSMLRISYTGSDGTVSLFVTFDSEGNPTFR